MVYNPELEALDDELHYLAKYVSGRKPTYESKKEILELQLQFHMLRALKEIRDAIKSKNRIT